jgi:ATP-dependent Clp protease ATP-binding subunit ClpC
VVRDVADPGELRGLDEAAVHAIALAASEAIALGHGCVGTEHLLLGLLTNASDASTRLTESGVTLGAARNKVTEAVGPSSRRGAGVGEPLPRTPRARRALGRAVRFAHVDGSDVVTSDHVLRGVLDVEGTAGQVLRGLGIDVDSLRASLEVRDAGPVAAPPVETAARSAGSPRCPTCNAAVDDQLVSRVVAATPESGLPHDAIVFSCGACGWVYGVGRA